MRTVCHAFEWYVERLVTWRPWTFVRYGDGEWNGMVWAGRKKGGGRTKNGDGHTLRNPDLREALRKSVSRPNDPWYIRSLWMDDQCVPHERLARDHADRLFPGVTWHNALAIQAKMNEGKGLPFVQAIRDRKLPLVVIGPDHLRFLPDVGVFKYDGFVEVPYRRAFFDRDRIFTEATDFPSPCLYTIHAGPASPVIAFDLWKAVGDKSVILDLGSIFDGFVAEKFGGPVPGTRPLTRKHWKHRCTRQIIDSNLGRGT